MMTDFNKCNGWTNYPTWTINLFFGADLNLEEFTDTTWIITRVSVDRAGCIYDLAEQIKDWFAHYFDENLYLGCGGQLFGYAFEQIDWYQLAENWLEH